MLDDIKAHVAHWENEGEVADYLTKILRKEANDGSGLIYGMGHAVYTLSDPRAVILKRKAMALAAGKEIEREFKLLDTIEKLTPELMKSVRGSDKVVCANVDMYSGLVYRMLGIPDELFTPLFATARMVGWAAHRMEEILTGKRIIRPGIQGDRKIEGVCSSMRPITQSRMRRRPVAASLPFCLLCCLLFSGCTPGATVDSLLKPPSLSEEQQQIYLALQDAVGSGITLQYPRAGANLSAFTVVDLDGDGEDEALVFYKKTNLAAVENGLRLSVLDQVKGKWMSVCDRPADGTEVERIVVSAMGDETQNQIFVGYSGVDQSDKSLTVYRYGDSQVEQLFTAAYTMFDVADLDGDQAQELLVLGKLTENASSSAAMYRLQDGSIKDNGKLDLRTGFTDFSRCCTARCLTAPPVSISTAPPDLRPCRRRSFTSRAIRWRMCWRTATPWQRPTVRWAICPWIWTGTAWWRFRCRNRFPAMPPDASEQVRLTRWLSVSGEQLTEKERGYFSLNDGCVFLLPLSWYDTVTAVNDTLTGDIVFCRYDGEINDHMTELLRYSVAQDTESQEERETEGYRLLHTRGKASYYMKPAETDDSLAQPWQELMVRFSFVQ